MVTRHGWWVAAHFGSPGGEIALCGTAVGLADRSDLGKLELRGEAGALETLVGQLTGGQVVPGEALLAAQRLVVLGLARARDRDLRRRAHRRCAPPSARPARWTPGVTVTDLTPRLAALGLIGPATDELLAELSGSLGPPTPRVRRDDAGRGAGDAAAQRRTPRGHAHRRRPRRRAVGRRRAGRTGLGLGHVGADAVSHVSPLA